MKIFIHFTDSNRIFKINILKNQNFLLLKKKNNKNCFKKKNISRQKHRY